MKATIVEAKYTIKVLVTDKQNLPLIQSDLENIDIEVGHCVAKEIILNDLQVKKVELVTVDNEQPATETDL
jgi:hypothetical protein